MKTWWNPLKPNKPSPLADESTGTISKLYIEILSTGSKSAASAAIFPSNFGNPHEQAHVILGVGLTSQTTALELEYG